MKKHLLALAALATVSGAAFAQNVTVYGILDTAYTSVNKVAATGGDRVSGINTATWMPSVIGFTGTEDLGGGLKATFQLESDINTDTGANAGGTTLFRRISTVGLSSNTYGTIKLGKHIDMLFLQSFINNVRPAHSGSLAVVGGVNYGASGANGTSDAEIFLSNGVQYQSPTFNGLSFKYQYRFGEATGNSSKDSGYAAGVNYDGIQNLSLSAVYKESKASTDAAPTNQRYTLLGAKYKVGQVTLAGQYAKYENPNSPSTLDTDAYEVGVAYAVTPQLTAAVNYISFDNSHNNVKPTHTSASLQYSLSKRTSLWTMYAVADNKGATSGVGRTMGAFYGSSAAAAGQKQTGIAAGVTHSF